MSKKKVLHEAIVRLQTMMKTDLTLSTERVAADIGVSFFTLKSWLRGVQPGQLALHAIELYLLKMQKEIPNVQ